MRLLPIITFSLVSIFSSIIYANANTLATPSAMDNTPTQLLPNKHNQCNKTLNYKIFRRTPYW